MEDGKYIEIGPHGLTIPYDTENDPTCDLISETIQEAIEELCNKVRLAVSVTYHYTRNGQVRGWLKQGTVFSNRVGIPFGLINGKLNEIWVGSRFNFAAGSRIKIYYHTGGGSGLTLLANRPLPTGVSEVSFDTDDFGVVAIPKDVQIAVRITGTKVFEPTVIVRPTGDRDV